MKPTGRNGVVVGLAPIVGAGPLLPRLEAGLSSSDRDRADRFRQPADRARFVVARALLALLLREELDYRPAVLELALTDKGRPHLADFPAVHFSISHAGDWVAVALAAGARVGVDVESLDRRLDLDPLAERIFDPADLARFRALPDSDRTRAFFRAWTGKEAVLKAKGLGLFGGVQEICVPLEDSPATVPDPDPASPAWHLTPLKVPGGHVGAAACDHADWQVDFRVYSLSHEGFVASGY
jgi:4'-phosphopantetheinyl transferase